MKTSKELPFIYNARERAARRSLVDSRKHLRTREVNVGDLVLRNDRKLKLQHSYKLNFQGTGPYRIADLVRGKEIYFLKELNGPRPQRTFA